jgi:hypothetical protein
VNAWTVAGEALMTPGRLVLHVLLIVSAGTVSRPLAAADPLGFYVGGAIGQATVRADHVLFQYPGDPSLARPISISGHDTGWKLLAGLRPISWIGAEIEYIDFGKPRVSHQETGVFVRNYGANMRAKAAAAFAVLYAPIPGSLLDVYGKAGLARLQASVNGAGAAGCIGGPALCPIFFGEVRREQTDIRFAFGAGAQVKLGAFSIRAEYERVSASMGDPDLLSIGATWSF